MENQTTPSRNRRATNQYDSPLPRMPAQFPQTPQSVQPVRIREDSARSVGRVPLPLLPERHRANTATRPLDNDEPLIPITVLDPASQRLYAAAAFGILQCWKVYDLGRLYNVEDPSISELWFILKWLFVDGLYIYSLPTLRIPWLKFTSQSVITMIVFMGAINTFFSLRYYLHLQIALLSLWKQIYNRELSISERRVKVNDLVFNSSHILGKHTLRFLPEGSAQINPHRENHCIDSKLSQVTIPIRINSTTPSLIQLGRRDFETSKIEWINITSRDVKRYIKAAPKEKDDNVHVLRIPITLPGVYRLQKVVDVSALVVRITQAEMMIVECPVASLHVSGPAGDPSDKCRGDLTDMALKVRGVAPMKVKYSRTINGDGKQVHIESIAPSDFDSLPLRHSGTEDPLVLSRSSESLSWAQPQDVTIALNESLTVSGSWKFAVEEVEDARGNVVKYGGISKSALSTKDLQHGILVHDRPQVKFSGCDAQSPLMVARGRTGSLPIEISKDVGGALYSLTYAFTPRDALSASSVEDSSKTVVKTVEMKITTQPIIVKDPGLYTLTGVSSQFCSGEVLESSTCLFLTSPEPSLSIATDQIVDKCAGSSIGLTIDLTLVGTPPFVVRYRKIKDKKDIKVESVRVQGTRHQLRLTPSAAGTYTYEFFDLDDAVYRGFPVDAKSLRAEQRVIPPAGASIVSSKSHQRCIDEAVQFEVRMQGIGPWQLNYELIHAGKRVKYTDHNITTAKHTITTPKLTDGGEYTLALATVQDSHGCKTFLESEARIEVRRQRPWASFAEVDGRKKIKALEGQSVDLPLRLFGTSPFTVRVRRLDAPVDSDLWLKQATDLNSGLSVKEQGRYEVVSVHDSTCPGTVGPTSGIFELEWIPKPSIRIADSPANTQVNGKLIRTEVCEGDEDSVEILFSGTPPYFATFERVFNGEGHNQRSLHPFDLKAATHQANIRMETNKAGKYSYNFLTLADGLYDKNQALPRQISLQQTVNSRPTAKFASPGKVYKYCLDAGPGDDLIAINLEGEPPFKIEVNVKHHATGQSETLHVANIETKEYKYKVPTRALALGAHGISIEKVEDKRGCSRAMAPNSPHVTISVADLPSVTELDNKPYYCVGERISLTLAGVSPFQIEYQFQGKAERATTPAIFQRIAERPGNLTFIALQDSASECKAPLTHSKMIYSIPSVRVSEGAQIVEGIHEGDHAEIVFTLTGEPPFTFTYTRSEIPSRGAKPRILEMHTETTDEKRHSIYASQEGTYEVISIHDRYCSYSSRSHVEDASKLLKYKD